MSYGSVNLNWKIGMEIKFASLLEPEHPAAEAESTIGSLASRHDLCGMVFATHEEADTHQKSLSSLTPGRGVIVVQIVT